MRISHLLTALIILAITLVACGGGEDEEPSPIAVTSTPTEEAAQQPTATDEPATEPPAQSTPVDPSATAATGEPEILLPEIRTGDIPSDGRFLGDPDAPVTLTEYGDFM